MSELRERQLREGNGRLKRLVADLSVDRQILQEIVSKSCKASFAAQAGAVGTRAYRISERHAARLVGLAIGTLRYRSRKVFDEVFRLRLRDLDGTHEPRSGVR